MLIEQRETGMVSLLFDGADLNKCVRVQTKFKILKIYKLKSYNLINLIYNLNRLIDKFDIINL